MTMQNEKIYAKVGRDGPWASGKSNGKKSDNALALVVHNRALFATPNGNVTPAIPDEVIDLLITPESVRNTWHSLTGYLSNVDPKRTLHDTLGHVALAVTYIERLQELLTRCQAYRELRKG